MSYQYSIAGADDCQSITTAMWFYLPAASGAAEVAEPKGPYLPLFEFGPSSDFHDGSFFWGPWQSGAYPGCPTSAAPSAPGCDTVGNSGGVDPNNRADRGGGDTSSYDAAYANVFASDLPPQGSPAPGPMHVIAWTPFIWQPNTDLVPMADGITFRPRYEYGCTFSEVGIPAGNPDLSTHGAPTEPGQFVAGCFIRDSFRGNGYADRPTVLKVNCSDKSIAFNTGTSNTKNPFTNNIDGRDFFPSIANMVVFNSWNHVFFTLDLGTDPYTWYMVVNGVEASNHTDDRTTFIAPYNMLVSNQPVSFPIVPNEIGRYSASGPNKLVRYAYAQTWFGLTVDPSPENLAMFFKIRGNRIVPPSDIKAAQKAFGDSDVFCYRDKNKGVHFQTNKSSLLTVPDFSVVGTPLKDYTPGPGQGSALQAMFPAEEPVALFMGARQAPEIIQPKITLPKHVAIRVNPK